MDEVFCECDESSDDLPIRQGDVFAWLNSVEDPWQQHGIVVTADCDIAHDKHGGTISYVPVLRVRDYLRLFLLPKSLAKASRTLITEFCAAVRRAQANKPEFPLPLSDDAILSWLRTASPAQMADELGVSDGRSRQQLLDAGNLLARLDVANDSSFDSQVDALTGARARSSKVGTEEARTAVLKDVCAKLVDLPGDAFFLSRLHADAGAGHVAYLRLVRELQHDQLAIRFTDLRRSAVRARRIARLASPYRYRLTQQLAAVFGAIGLPDEYETSRSTVATALSELDISASPRETASPRP